MGKSEDFLSTFPWILGLNSGQQACVEKALHLLSHLMAPVCLSCPQLPAPTLQHECAGCGFAGTPACNTPRGQRRMPVPCSLTASLTPLRAGLSLNLDEAGSRKPHQCSCFSDKCC